MNVEALKKEIELREDKIIEEEAAIDKIKQSIADYLCPFVVGEKIVYEEGKIATIESIKYSNWALCGYNGSIRKIKKDGTPYKYPNDCYALEDYKKYIEPEGE